MNKLIKYLVESFDDLFDDDDIFGDDSIKDMEKQFEDIVYDKLLEIVKLSYFRSYTWSKPKDDKVYIENIDKYTYFYFYNEKDYNKKEIISEFHFNNINEATEFLKLLYSLNLKYILGSFKIYGYVRYNTNKNNIAINKVIDLNNIQFLNYQLEFVIVNNLYVDETSFNNIDQIENNIDCYNYKYKFRSKKNCLIMSYCKLGENVNVQKAEEVYLRNIYNLNDYSFIKHVNEVLTINIDDKNGLPKCNNLKGIPTSGNYELKVFYRSDNKLNEYDDMELQTMEYIPNNVSHILYDIAVRPWYFLHNFSFKGLTKELLSKLKFTVHYFKGKDFPVPVRLGPFELNVKAKKWKPTKPQFETIITTQDWFLDCWLTEPHKTYTEPETANIDVKQLKKVENYKQKINDEQEDKQKMTKLLIQILNKYNIFYTSYNSLTIKEITDNYIKYIINGRYYSNRIYNDSYEKFLTYYILSKTAPELYIFSPNDKTTDQKKNKTLKDLVLIPIKKQRDKINKQRKEQEKLERQQQKQSKTTNDTITTVSDNTETVQTKKTYSDVSIVDYSDRAIAVIGNTYVIKDKLKELGAKFNKFLSIDGKKTPGWILSKTKKTDVEKILNDE